MFYFIFIILFYVCVFKKTNRDVVPPTFEAGYFHSRASEQELAPDGYDAQFSPPPPFEKRVWGGATLNWNISNPLKVI